MPDLFHPGALSALGWDDRVLAFFNEARVVAGPDLRPARAVRIERVACAAATADGDIRYYRAASLPAVGDWLAVMDDTVVSVLPRWSALARTGPSGEPQVLAANVDLVFITVPADRPNIARVERELVVAWDSGATPMLLLTKADVAGAAQAAAELDERLAGTEVLAVSATTGHGLVRLRACLAPHRTAVLLGPSGAGKSTLANALLGADVLSTGAVRGDDHRGRHTTTSRQLVAIPGGGVLIDTPGLRSVALSGGEDLAETFSDVGAISDACHFSNCRHHGEPGCAVALALSRGELTEARVASFSKLQREAAMEQRKHDPLARKAEQMVWKRRSKEARLHSKHKPG